MAGIFSGGFTITPIEGIYQEKQTVSAAGGGWWVFLEVAMYESKLEVNENGGKYLVCFYDKALKNWNEIIERALLRHKLKVGQVPVLCLPMKNKVVNDRTYKRICDSC